MFELMDESNMETSNACETSTTATTNNSGGGNSGVGSQKKESVSGGVMNGNMTVNGTNSTTATTTNTSVVSGNVGGVGGGGGKLKRWVLNILVYTCNDAMFT